jgi:hypothetical protein
MTDFNQVITPEENGAIDAGLNDLKDRATDPVPALGETTPALPITPDQVLTNAVPTAQALVAEVAKPASEDPSQDWESTSEFTNTDIAAEVKMDLPNIADTPDWPVPKISSPEPLTGETTTPTTSTTSTTSTPDGSPTTTLPPSAGGSIPPTAAN